MSAVAAAFASRKTRHWIMFGSALVLVAGIVAFLVAFVGNTGNSASTPITNKPAQTYKTPKKVPLSTEARKVAGRFILTAVQRKDLTEAWRISGPNLKSGYTLKAWLTGNIPVIPYPDVALSTIKVDRSNPRYALLEVLLLPKSNKVKAQMFFLEMKKYGGRWLVTSWTPRTNIARPGTLTE